jgi:hypothetical protein
LFFQAHASPRKTKRLTGWAAEYKIIGMIRWTELILGIWILLSPWLLGFSSISVMKWSNLLAGLAIILINVWAIFEEKKIPQGAANDKK